MCGKVKTVNYFFIIIEPLNVIMSLKEEGRI